MKTTIEMTQAQARERYPKMVRADGDYTIMLCTSRNAARALRDWQEENPDAYLSESEWLIGRCYDATKNADLVDAASGRPIRITVHN